MNLSGPARRKHREGTKAMARVLLDAKPALLVCQKCQLENLEFPE